MQNNRNNLLKPFNLQTHRNCSAALLLIATALLCRAGARCLTQRRQAPHPPCAAVAAPGRPRASTSPRGTAPRTARLAARAAQRRWASPPPPSPVGGHSRNDPLTQRMCQRHAVSMVKHLYAWRPVDVGCTKDLLHLGWGWR